MELERKNYLELDIGKNTLNQSEEKLLGIRVRKNYLELEFVCPQKCGKSAALKGRKAHTFGRVRGDFAESLLGWVSCSLFAVI